MGRPFRSALATLLILNRIICLLVTCCRLLLRYPAHSFVINFVHVYFDMLYDRSALPHVSERKIQGDVIQQAEQSGDGRTTNDPNNSTALRTRRR